MPYDDGRVALTEDALVIRMYYFPFGAKRIRYADIGEVRRRPLSLTTGRYQIWGSGDIRHWFNYDPDRPKKTAALFINPKGKRKPTVPVITPDRPDEVAAELSAHGVNVTDA